MSRNLFLIAPALVLAGCHSSPAVEAKNASVAEVAKQVSEARASGSFVSPGQWRTTTTVKEMNIPGMPPQVAAQMQARMAKPNIAENCVTKEQAEKPSAEMFAGRDSGQCRFEHFTMAGGKIDAVMHCQPRQGGPEMNMTLNGTYSADAYQMNAAMTQEGPGGTMSTRIQTDATRIGECKG